MKSPLFYLAESVTETASLNEETSKHISGVLRMQIGDRISLTDGKGNLHEAEITDHHKKKVKARILHSSFRPRKHSHQIIACSLLKNTGRFEWFIEKSAELGIQTIIPLLCERTEKQTLRFERMQQILVSAMIQSEQAYLPHLAHPALFHEVIQQQNVQHKFIAYCSEDTSIPHFKTLINRNDSSMLLVGPEGDFTLAEINDALNKQFVPVSLGDNRLRSETAAITGAVLMTML
ncbi:MAG TPA: RsmE family RNA methyltransferase [Flavitalea sp.]|nr:RsmE family RNA methyltransferase [Flavitalea sp.]